MATSKHQERDIPSLNNGRSDNEGRYKVSVSGPSFHIECTLYRSNQCSVLVTDHRGGRQTKIVVDVKEEDTSEIPPLSVQTTDHHDGNSGVESDRPDQEMTEISL
ncbi:uncharacterized protein LOC115924681 [Strongylocentrotus purpuratus]|uniref:Uncharacterized protein n=1 Tax=Strongylocentrotus purpuratus TaxID=7668 RepID=A0A7M7NY35_STRPU|nr:uncharacterized protein LOC115924681 [Strongylocentrotus purpuratus]